MGALSFVIQASENKRVFFASLILWIVTFVGMGILSSLDPATAAEKPGIPDLAFTLSPDQIHATLVLFGESGRKIYLVCEIFDIFPYMFGYSIFFTLLGIRVLSQFLPQCHAIHYACFLPLISHMFDLVETSIMIHFLSIFPARNDSLALVYSAFLSAKWSCLYVFFFIIAVTLVLGFFRWVRARSLASKTEQNAYVNQQ
eukprot:GILI01025989.1.p1 GENE.GILI01025989.1~~GILI01025989.1.p1  ORF type:complete len:200 (+),score=21.79 GILI01025989.1:32-631(+)